MKIGNNPHVNYKNDKKKLNSSFCLSSVSSAPIDNQAFVTSVSSISLYIYPNNYVCMNVCIFISWHSYTKSCILNTQYIL